MFSFTCIVCGKVFETNIHNRISCSKECQKINRDNKRQERSSKKEKKPKKIIQKQCVVCLSIFDSISTRNVYCSSECRETESQKRRHETYENNKDVVREQSKRWYEENKERKLARGKLWDTNNREKRNAITTNWFNRKKATDPTFKLRLRVSSQIYQHLRGNGGSKNGESILLHLDYTIDQLRAHLELLWEPWMNWENYGKYDPSRKTWNIDHIIPQSELPFDSFEHPNFLRCWDLLNLQPKETIKNIQKGNKMPLFITEL